MSKRDERKLEDQIKLLKQAREVDRRRMLRVRRRSASVNQLVDELIETITPNARQRELIGRIQSERGRRR